MRNAVIFHHPDGVDTSREKLMGRHAAGEGFLTGFVRHSGAQEIFTETVADEHHSDLTERVRTIAGRKVPCRRVSIGDYGDPEVPSMLMLPTPDFDGFAWRRRQRGRMYDHGICGLNHTVASPGVMEALTALVRAPLAPWDALICTSSSIRRTIQSVLDQELAYLSERFGTSAKLDLELPVIPLGVDCERFQIGKQADLDRVHLREGMGIKEGDIAVLYLGRLSFHAKAHPLPMLLAAEEAARRTGRRIHVIMAGWFASEAIERAFRDAAREFAPSVRALFLDSRDRDVRERIWHAADIFMSLSDNIQESFGLTPIEAMAAGLPVIVSNWDGYRETVRHGIDGLLIPTWMPAPGSGDALAMPADIGVPGPDDSRLYDRYCGNVSQTVAIDTEACVEALVELILEPEKRAAMGEAGRRRARETFDWRHVVSAYQSLWTELDERRRRAKAIEHGDLKTFVPQRPDPYAMYGAHPSHVVDDRAEIRPARGGGIDALATRLEHAMNGFAGHLLLPKDDLETILAIVSDTGGLRVKALMTRLDGRDTDATMRSVAWLAKMNLISLLADQVSANEITPANVEAAAEQSAPETETAEEPVVSNELKDIEDTDLPAPLSDDLPAEPPAAEAKRAQSRAMQAVEEANADVAIQGLERARVLSPEDPRVNRELGTLLGARGDTGEAETLLRRAHEKEPSDIGIINDLGKALFLNGKESEAVHTFRRAVRLAPDDGESRYLLGLALRRSGAFNEAVRCLRLAAEIEPDHLEPKYHLGLAYEQLGRFDEAARCYEDARKIDPDNPLIDAALLSAEAASENRARDMGDARKVLFHISSPGDVELIRQVFSEIADDCWPLISADDAQIKSFNPGAAVIIGGQALRARELSGNGPVVLLPSTAVRDAQQLANAVLADRVGALSLRDADLLVEAGVDRRLITVTGLPIADPLFCHDRIGLPKGFDASRRRVVFAPHSISTSAASVLGDFFQDALEVLPEDVDIVIWPRAETIRGQNSWMEAWQEICSTSSRLLLVRDPGLSPTEIMAAADIMIADPSDRAALFLATDRPLIVTGKRHASIHALADPLVEAIEHAADVVYEADRLPSALEAALKAPDARSEERARARAIIFEGMADGRAAARAGEAVLEAISGR